MAKTKPVKWALGSDEPEDTTFLSNDEIKAKNTNKKTKEVDWPGKGPFKFKVRRLSIKPNKNGDDRISAMLVMDEPDNSWNGYLIWDGFNVTEQGKSFINRFLKGMGLSWGDFMSKTKQNDEDPPQIVQIGGVKFGEAASKDPSVMATVKVKDADDFNDDDYLDTARYLPADDGDGDDDDAAPTDAGSSFDEPAADGEGSDEAWTREDFDDEDEYPDKEVKKIAVSDFEIAKSDLKGLDRDGMLDLMFAGVDKPEDREAQEEELRTALKAEKVGALRKRALRNDNSAETEGVNKSDLVDLIVEQELPPF